jgi:glycogen debranching enzyme
VQSFLAATQATSTIEAQDAQPGKILHEMRGGEMAALGEVPFGRYYGTSDATPLFVTLAAAYYGRTGDAALIDQIWPNIIAALEWMRVSGDVDGDGFIEYARQTEHGLIQQGWKDSHDSIFHADGTLAEAPIALCEVQAYAYGAWKGAARLAVMRGDKRAADDWHARAAQLRARFEQAFWCEDLGTYALALDGQKRPCRVRTSNAGQCLFTGIASAEHAKRVCATLFDDPMFSGWGLRTVAVGEARYNPMSYHNGSIWPHDNALVAMGLSRYGYTAAAGRILSTMFDLSEVVDLHRLPELICGFPRRGREHPTQYPVACAPQAWAAGAVYMLLAACLGLRIDAPARRLSFSMSELPESIEWLRLSNLVIGDARVDLRLERHPHDVGLTVLRREGQLDIVAVR